MNCLAGKDGSGEVGYNTFQGNDVIGTVQKMASSYPNHLKKAMLVLEPDFQKCDFPFWWWSPLDLEKIMSAFLFHRCTIPIVT